MFQLLRRSLYKTNHLRPTMNMLSLKRLQKKNGEEASKEEWLRLEGNSFSMSVMRQRVSFFASGSELELEYEQSMYYLNFSSSTSGNLS